MYTGRTGGLVKLSTPFGHSDVSRMSTPLNLSPEHCSTMLEMSCFEKYGLWKFMAYTGLKSTLSVEVLTLLNWPHFHCLAQQSSLYRKLHPGRLSGDQRTWWTSLADLVEIEQLWAVNFSFYMYIIHSDPNCYIILAKNWIPNKLQLLYICIIIRCTCTCTCIYTGLSTWPLRICKCLCGHFVPRHVMLSHSSPPSGPSFSKNWACSVDWGPRIKVGRGAAGTCI